MSVQCLEPKDFSEAINLLLGMADLFPETEFVFRGQADSSWRLSTTYDRYWGGTAFFSDQHLEGMVAKFRAGLARLSFDSAPLRSADRLTWLEFSRHHGLPAPLLDFSWSPFIATFFAFDGTREVPEKPPQSAAVYALNLTQLAKEIARREAGDDMLKFPDLMNAFLLEGNKRFDNSYPEDSLLFIRHPSAHTRRMMAQMGVFLYVTLNLSGKDLESFFGEISEGFDSPTLPNTKAPVLTKIKMPYEWATEVFSRLELMSINGAALLLSPEGVARDVFNSYHYHVRSAYLRD